MERRTYKDVTEFLKAWSEDSQNLNLRGMLKESKKKDVVEFSQTNCEAWVEIAKKDIVSIEYVGNAPCVDDEHGPHEHPIVLLEMKSDDTTAGRLLKAFASRPAGQVGMANVRAAQTPMPASNVRTTRGMGGTGAQFAARAPGARQPQFQQMNYAPMYSEPYCPNGSGPCGGYLPNGVECANYARPCYNGNSYSCAYSEYCDCVNNGC